MKRMLAATIFSLMFACLTATTASAQSPHYKKFPTCVASALTVTCTGSISGLGNGNVIVNVGFTQQDGSTATTTCTNAGGNSAPGQNPAVPVAVTGSQLVTKFKNGTLSFTVTTTKPDNPTSAQAGCPNGNWSASIDVVTFHGGTLTVNQEDVQGSGNFLSLPGLTINPLFP